jgi:putative DNA primase/helicase
MTKTTRGPCPQCNRGPKDTALARTEDERGVVEFCHRCGYTKAENYERRPLEPVRSAPAKSDAPLEWSDKAESIWRRTKPLRGTLGQTYLEHRGCILPPADSDLRFLPASDKYAPTLCAKITDATTNAPLSLHFTRLAADGRGKSDCEQPKLLLSGHRKRGGVIRLWPNECVTYGLGVAEGIESALAAAHLFTPIWSTVDAGNLAALPVVNGVEALTIYADNDEAGIKAARECARRWHAAGREVRIRAPRAEGKDAADLAKGVAA